MNDMKEKAMGAVRAFLERKGYEIVDEVCLVQLASTKSAL